MSLTIEPIRPAHVDLLAQFFAENDLPAVTDTFRPFPLTRDTARWIALEPHTDRFYLGLHSGRAIGFSMLRGWDEGYTIPSFGMFIDHRRQGQGYGKTLLDLTVQEAYKTAAHQVRLSVFASNTPACRIYLQQGFHEIERTLLDYPGCPDYKIIMLKDLTA